MLGQGQYDEFAQMLHLLIEPLRAAAPQIVFRPYNLQGHGRPGILALGKRTAAAKYQYQLSILMRWRDSAMLDMLEGDSAEREILRGSFARRTQWFLSDMEARYCVDWGGGSQDSPQGLTIELEEF